MYWSLFTAPSCQGNPKALAGNKENRSFDTSPPIRVQACGRSCSCRSVAPRQRCHPAEGRDQRQEFWAVQSLCPSALSEKSSKLLSNRFEPQYVLVATTIFIYIYTNWYHSPRRQNYTHHSIRTLAHLDLSGFLVLVSEVKSKWHGSPCSCFGSWEGLVEPEN